MSTSKDDMEAMTRVEVEAITDMHRRLVDQCWAKCVPHIKDGELAIGEMTCVDRCVPKYFAVHDIVREEYTKSNEALAQQQRMKDALNAVKSGGQA